MTNTEHSTAASDVAYVLHQYTNLKQHREKGPLVIERGDGIYVEDDTGRRYIEAMAGLRSGPRSMPQRQAHSFCFYECGGPAGDCKMTPSSGTTLTLSARH